MFPWANARGQLVIVVFSFSFGKAARLQGESNHNICVDSCCSLPNTPFTSQIYTLKLIDSTGVGKGSFLVRQFVVGPDLKRFRLAVQKGGASLKLMVLQTGWMRLDES